MKPKNQPLNPGCFYHIYNRGNNRENLFYKYENYVYFLQKYDYYLNDYLETYAYCLLPNHFHLLVRVKNKENLPGFKNLAGLSPEISNSNYLPGLENLEGLSTTVSKQFSNFFNAYAKAINKRQNRIGSLFQKNFKRILVSNEKYLTNLIYYIHANPQIHELIDDFRNWPYSSYGKIVEAKKSHLKKNEVLDFFGSVEEYKLYHSMMHNTKIVSSFLIE